MEDISLSMRNLLSLTDKLLLDALSYREGQRELYRTIDEAMDKTFRLLEMEDAE